jgi:D-alanyl-D-alanine carboxypeptidase (penicillin-binding protein 5/6)
MKSVKLIFFATLSVCLFFVSEISHARHAAILVDASNGSVLNQVEASQPWYPASLTKLMTIYMAFDVLSTGRIQLQDRLSASYHASRQPNSKLGLRVGESLTVEDAILALVTRSANDAAVALAEYIGGTEESFAVKMTEKAHSIGMYDSHFMNATGLPHPWQVSTARDLGLLAWRTINNFPEYYPYFSAHSFSFRGRELHAINKFTEHYPGAEGMKTGFTCGSGYNLISTASQNGKRLIGVILGGMTSPQRYQLMINMMDAGFANQYTIDPTSHIEKAIATIGSTPPHQLGCGNGGSLVVASTEDENSDRIVHRAKIVQPKPSRVNHHKGGGKVKAAAKVKSKAVAAKKAGKKHR